MSDTNEMRALICHQCGAPMKSRSKCNYCGTSYEYIGPPVPEYRGSPNLVGHMGGSTFFNPEQSFITSATYSTGRALGFINPPVQFTTVWNG